METLLLVLPWMWIAAAVCLLAILAPRSSSPGAVNAFAAVLVAMGISEFFVTPRGPVPWWLLAWKIACVLTAAGIVVRERLRRTHRRRDQEPG